MEIAVITSRKDIAGMSISKSLIGSFRFLDTEAEFDGTAVKSLASGKKRISLYTITEDTVHAEGLDSRIEADIFVFATRHQSASGKPALLVHTPGNFSSAALGGTAGKLSVAAPLMAKSAFTELCLAGKGLGWDISMEVTHHGPLLSRPSMFIEIGSAEEQWRNRAAADVIAKVILSAAEKYGKKAFVPAIGLGGPHYCPNFNAVQIESNYAIGHICPKYMLEKVDPAMMREMMGRSSPEAEIAVLDWKGMGPEKERILRILDENKIKYVKTKEI